MSLKVRRHYGDRVALFHIYLGTRPVDLLLVAAQVEIRT